MLRIAFLVLILIVLPAGTASAQWFHKSDDDPFKGKATHLAMTMKSGQSAAFRCSGSDDLTLLFIVPEKVTDTTTKMLRAAGVKLLIIIDDAPKIELDAEVEAVGEATEHSLESYTRTRLGQVGVR